MYTLGGGIDEERGWGRAGESWTVKEELAAYDADPTWFGLGDRDLATHLVRTRMLDAGYPLSAVTAALADRWQPGVTLLPMSDQRVETHVVVADPETGRQQAIHFQEWWVRHRAGPGRRRRSSRSGVDAARPAPGVVEAFAAADAVLLAPSNPVVSIGTILGVPGLREALLAAAGPHRRRLADRRRRGRARHGRPLPARARHRGQRRGRRAALRRPGRRRPARRLAGAPERRRPTCPASTSGRCRC